MKHGLVLFACGWIFWHYAVLQECRYGWTDISCHDTPGARDLPRWTPQDTFATKAACEDALFATFDRENKEYWRVTREAPVGRPFFRMESRYLCLPQGVSPRDVMP
jgi:hypothetical protein